MASWPSLVCVAPAGVAGPPANGCLARSDPYVVVRLHNNTIAKSNVVDNNLNPVWEPFVVDVAAAGGMYRARAIIMIAIIAVADRDSNPADRRNDIAARGLRVRL